MVPLKDIEVPAISQWLMQFPFFPISALAQITVGVSSLAFYKWRERYSELTIEIAIDDSMADIQILYNFRKYFLINNL